MGNFLSLGFGSGLSPFAPGTAGTLLAVILYIPLSTFPLWLFSTILVIGTVVGIYLCQKTSDKLGVNDHPAIVWDEFIGYWLTMFMAPAGWQWIVLGFVLA